MKDPKTFAFIKRKGVEKYEKFLFPKLETIFPRLKSKEICKIELENNFIQGWKENKNNKPNLLGNVMQRITFKDGEVFERIIQCRIDDSKHDNTSLHINVDVLTRGKTIKKEKKSHKGEVKLHYSIFDLNNLEYTWVGVFYPGRQCIQPILFPHNEKAKEYLEKQEQFLRNRNFSKEEMKNLSSELMRLYKEMNLN